MSRSVQIALGSILGVIIIGLAVGMFLFNKSHADVAGEDAAYSLSATELFTAFEADEAAANEQYLNQLIAIQGRVSEKKETEEGGIVLLLEAEGAMFGVNCAFQPEERASLNEIEPGAEVTVKGLCSGMLMDVSLSRCVLIDH